MMPEPSAEDRVRDAREDAMWLALTDEWCKVPRPEQRAMGFDAFKETFAAGWDRRGSATEARYAALVEAAREMDAWGDRVMNKDLEVWRQECGERFTDLRLALDALTASAPEGEADA